MKKSQPLLPISLLLIFPLFAIVACASAPTTGASGEEMEQMEEEMVQEMEHDDDHAAAERVPNEGAVVRIVSPADGAVFESGEEIVVEIETENFDLGEEDNHWHVYVDGASWGMVMGSNTDEVLRGVEPGAHALAVYLSIGTHEELEEGDTISITVEE